MVLIVLGLDGGILGWRVWDRVHVIYLVVYGNIELLEY